MPVPQGRAGCDFTRHALPLVVRLGIARGCNPTDCGCSGSVIQIASVARQQQSGHSFLGSLYALFSSAGEDTHSIRTYVSKYSRRQASKVASGMNRTKMKTTVGEEQEHPQIAEAALAPTSVPSDFQQRASPAADVTIAHQPTLNSAAVQYANIGRSKRKSSAFGYVAPPTESTDFSYLSDQSGSEQHSGVHSGVQDIRSNPPLIHPWHLYKRHALATVHRASSQHAPSSNARGRADDARHRAAGLSIIDRSAIQSHRVPYIAPEYHNPSTGHDSGRDANAPRVAIQFMPTTYCPRQSHALGETTPRFGSTSSSPALSAVAGPRSGPNGAHAAAPLCPIAPGVSSPRQMLQRIESLALSSRSSSVPNPSPSWIRPVSPIAAGWRWTGATHADVAETCSWIESTGFRSSQTFAQTSLDGSDDDSDVSVASIYA